MTRGTTPEIVATIRSIDFRNIAEMVATFKQGKVEIEKTKGDMVFEPPHVHVFLTQADTLSLAEGECDIQIRGMTNDGEVFATNVAVLPVRPILKEGAIE